MSQHPSRRDFIRAAAASASLLAASDRLSAAAREIQKYDNGVNAAQPWYRTLTRWGQVNITEKDPENYDVDWWRKYWKKTSTQGVIINAGGIVSYYPSKVPLHRQAAFLKGMDLFGKLCRAAHDEGLAVFARMDSNRAHQEFFDAHPDWFSIDGNGKPYKAADLYLSCIFSPYYTEHIPAILNEIVTLYKPEGFTDNSWSGIGRDMICYCHYCRRDFKTKTGNDIPFEKNWNDPVYRQWIRWNYDRRLEIWELNNKTTKAAGGVDCVWAGMNSGSITGQSRSFRDLREICRRADIIMLDHQARGENELLQHNTETGLLVHGLLGWDKLIPESMAIYQAGLPTFRLSSKPLAEARMWMINGIAGGIQPWWHHVAAYHEDRRMYDTAAPVMQWQKEHEALLVNREPLASVGVVWSQQNTDFFGRDDAGERVDLPWQGITRALVRARIPYIPVHADDIEKESGKISLLILPNIGVMSDSQVMAVKKFVDKGGNLIATGETSLYDEWGDKKEDFGLGDIFGAHKINGAEPVDIEAMPKLAWNVRYHTYLRLHPELRSQVDGPKNGKEPTVMGIRHEILKGFEKTDILPFGGFLEKLAVAPGVEVPMTFIPQFPVYPPETAWMREPKTDIPGMFVSKKTNGARVIFMPADIDKQFGRDGLPDHGELLQNMITWAGGDSIPVHIDGPGLISCTIYSQPGKMILHLVNQTSAAAFNPPMDELIRVGPLRVKVKTQGNISGKNVRLQVSNRKTFSAVRSGWTHFTIDSLHDHEMIVIT